MKILHIVPSYKPAYIYGGPIESVARLCEGLAEAGHTVHVFTTTANGKNELDITPGKAVEIAGVTVTYFKRITKDHTHISPSLWMRLYRAAKDYDLVHIHSWWSVLVIVATLILHLRKVKVLVSPRGMLSQYILTATHSNTKKWIHKIVGKRALSQARLHATSPAELEDCHRLIPGWKGFELPNILQLCDSEILRIANPTFTLLFLSRIHPKKGLELLFEAISGLPFAVTLRISGSGEDHYIQKLKKKAQELGITQSLVWLGWSGREDKFKELMGSDLFVLTSHNENFANVVIESLHVGTPVLISKEVGLAPFVQENGLGWVTPLEVEAIKDCIENAYQNKQKRKSISDLSRITIERTFSQPVLIQKYVDEYEKLSRAVA